MITARFEDLVKSMEVVKQWIDERGFNQGVVGIHLEGPYLSAVKKGIHCESLLQHATKA
jgi:N-acetylglucosamine-6-phosphate deacetylase